MVGENVNELIRAIGSDAYNGCLDMVNANICMFCEKPVDQTAFTSDEARKEFEMSGMCQTCFDSFGKQMCDQFDKIVSTLNRVEKERFLAFMIDRRLKLEGKR